MSAAAGHARTILAALDAGRAIAPITEADPGFGLDAAYAVSGAVMAARVARGIGPGDLVTTGTIIRAFPVRAGETWTTRVEGLALPGLKLAFAPAS